MKYLEYLENEKENIGIIANMFTEQLFEKNYNIIALPNENYTSILKEKNIKKLLIEPVIFEECHDWYEKSMTDILTVSSLLGVEIIVLNFSEDFLDEKYQDYKKIKIDYNLEKATFSDSTLHTPFMLNSEIYNPLNNKYHYDVIYIGEHENEFNDELKTLHNRTKMKVKKINIHNISRESLTEVIGFIRQTKILYISEGNNLPKKLIYYLELISTLLNTIIVLDENIIEHPKFAHISSNKENILYIMQALIQNRWFFDKNIISKTRKALINNTEILYGDIVLSEKESSKKIYTENISVLISTKRKEFIQSFLSQVNQQEHVNLQIILLTHGFKLSSRDKTEFKKLSSNELEIVECDESVSFGQCLNMGIEKIKYNYVIKMDDDDYYYPNFIIDIYLGLRYSQATLSGKHAFFFYLEDENIVGQRRINKQYVYTSEIKGNTMLCSSDVFKQFKFNDLPRHIDSDFIQRIRENKGKVYCIHPYDMCVYRASNKENHTYQVEDSRFLRDAEILYYGSPNKTISSDSI